MKIGSITKGFKINNQNNNKVNNTSYQNLVPLKQDTIPSFSTNQYLINFKGLNHINTDIKVVKQELDNLFSEPDKLTDPYKYNIYDNHFKFLRFLCSEQDDISKLAFSYLKKDPLVLEEFTVDPHTEDPLTTWGSGATKALLEYLEDKSELKEKILFAERRSFICGRSALSGPGAKSVWNYYKDKDDEFKELIIKNATEPFYDINNGVTMKILERFKNNDETLKELFNLKSTYGRDIFCFPPYRHEISGKILNVLEWIETEKPELFKEICHKVDEEGDTILNLLNVGIYGNDEKYPFINYFKDKKNLVDELFLKEVKLKDGSKKLIGENLRGKPFEFALDCVKDKVKLYKILKKNDELSILNNAENPHVLIKFFDEVIQTLQKPSKTSH